MKPIAWPQVLIGILVTIIVMQWAMPSAQSQSESVTAGTFHLTDNAGNIVGGFSTDDDGAPYLFLNKGGTGFLLTATESAVEMSASHSNGPTVWLTATPDEAIVAVSAQLDVADNLILLGAREGPGRTFASIASEGEWTVIPEGANPNVTAAKPTTWGQGKQRIEEIPSR